MLPRSLALFALAFFLGFVLGCGDAQTDKTNGGKTAGAKTTGGKTAEGDPEDKPLTDAEKQALKASIKDYQDALAKIKAYRDTIQKETTTGRPALAHRPLDELALVLEWLPEFAKKSGVPEAKLEDLTKSAQKLNDAFDKVHQKIDAGEKPDYAAVSGTIETEIKALDGLAAAKE
jgi:hypothetical protein